MARSVKAPVRFAATMTAMMLVWGISACGRPAQDANATAAIDTNAAAALPPLPGALPLASGPVGPAAPAPSAAALPGRILARPARLADPRARYAYLDRAYGQSAAADVAPPDYAFDYGAARPWTWDAGDRSREIVEPVSGGYRYYYYSPGADAPYLVRDPGYSYAYDGVALVAVFDREGRALPPDPGYQQALYAGRYLARARSLYAASLQSNRSSVIAADWAAHRAEVAAARAQWAAQQARQAEWQAYHAQHRAEEQSYWQSERARREVAAARFDDWHTRSFNGPPPALYAAGTRATAVAFASPVIAPPPRAVQAPVIAAQPVTVPPFAVVPAPPAPVARPAPVTAERPRPAPPQMPHFDRTFAPHAQYSLAGREPVAAPPPVHAARTVEPRLTPGHNQPPRPDRAPPAEQVIVARGADTPRPEAARHSEPVQPGEPMRPHDPRSVPAPHPVAVRPPEPRRAAPPPEPHPRAPEPRPDGHRDHHAEPAHQEDHAHDHR